MVIIMKINLFVKNIRLGKDALSRKQFKYCRLHSDDFKFPIVSINFVHLAPSLINSPKIRINTSIVSNEENSVYDNRKRIEFENFELDVISIWHVL